MAYILPLIAISEMCETVVPVEAPRYKTFEVLVIFKFSNPFKRAAANLERLGFHNLYSSFSLINSSP